MDEIFEAISQGNAAQGIAVLKSKKGLNLETRDKDGMTCLMNACYKGMTDLVEMLIDSGADFNAKVFPHQYTPLMFAAMSGTPLTMSIVATRRARTHPLSHTLSLFYVDHFHTEILAYIFRTHASFELILTATESVN
eukprot:m.66609 g.66609  ORF g.66609 m.66609 type:complete len:137 (-) comp12127_c0_seq2:212-622(-)